MKTIKLTAGHFSEIYADGLRFGLLDSKGDLYNGTTCCKDFFTDAFWCEHHKTGTNIWGFECTPGRMDLGALNYQIALHRKSESLGNKAAALQEWLRMFDKAFGFGFTKVEPINDGKDLLITFVKEWASRPVMISLFTGMCRVGMMYAPPMSAADLFDKLKSDGNPYGQYDQSEFFHGKKVVPLILSCLETGKTPHPAQTFKQYKAAHDAHHGGGFIAHTDGRQTG